MVLLLSKRLEQVVSGIGVEMDKAVKTGTSELCSTTLGGSISNDIESSIIFESILPF